MDNIKKIYFATSITNNGKNIANLFSNINFVQQMSSIKLGFISTLSCPRVNQLCSMLDHAFDQTLFV